MRDRWTCLVIVSATLWGAPRQYNETGQTHPWLLGDLDRLDAGPAGLFALGVANAAAAIGGQLPGLPV
jgi:hypothetical protein